MNIPKRTTVTAALPYANGPLHIGHIAGVYLPADTYVRYLRMQERDVVFVCGSDEHGAAISIKARKEGISPQEVVDKYHAINQKAFADFGIRFDIYHRTSDPLHHRTAQDFFLKLLENKAFEISTSEQFFDVEAGQFLADRFIVGTCPKCGYENAYGDQCENCGSTLSPQELIHPRSMLSGGMPELRQTEHWYLPLNAHEDWLRTWITDGTIDGEALHDPSLWKKQVIGQCKSWIDGGLQPRAMTRDLDWGVKVPVAGAEGKVLYVWLDAPIGYISATKAWAEESGKDWKPYWQSPDTKLVHFLAKDNIVFHCIIFPALLRAHGDFILPENVPANEFLNLEGKKISTSRNWAVWLHEYMEDFPGKEDELRYVLTAIAPEFRDSEFTWGDYQARINNELVAILGNFVNRTFVLVHKFFDGQVPEATHAELDVLVPGGLAKALKTASNSIAESLELYRFRDAQAEMMNVARIGNKLLTETEPWKLIKTAPYEAGLILNACLQITANLRLLTEPFLPKTAVKLGLWLGLPAGKWADAGRLDLLPAGAKLRVPDLLYTRIDDDMVEAQLAKLEATAAETILNTAKVNPEKPTIAYDDFIKMDIRTAVIVAAERVPKTDKLLKITLNTGVDTRTVVSGIAAYFDPEKLAGQQVTVLLNLAPRKIKGIDSQGMILMAEEADGSLRFVRAEGEPASGSEVR